MAYPPHPVYGGRFIRGSPAFAILPNGQGIGVSAARPILLDGQGVGYIMTPNGLVPVVFRNGQDVGYIMTPYGLEPVVVPNKGGGYVHRQPDSTPTPPSTTANRTSSQSHGTPPHPGGAVPSKAVWDGQYWCYEGVRWRRDGTVV